MNNQRPSIASVLRSADAAELQPLPGTARPVDLAGQFGPMPQPDTNAYRAIATNAALEALAMHGQNRVSAAQQGAVELIARTLARLAENPAEQTPAPGPVAAIAQVEQATASLMGAATLKPDRLGQEAAGVTVAAE